MTISWEHSGNIPSHHKVMQANQVSDEKLDQMIESSKRMVATTRRLSLTRPTSELSTVFPRQDNHISIALLNDLSG